MGLTASVTKHDGPIDRPNWDGIRREILASLDLAAEFQALGVRTSDRSRPDSKGWVDCHAIGRPDENPSASINLVTGHYRDRLDGEKAIGLFDLAAREGLAPTWVDARRLYAEKAGVDLPRVSLRRDGSFISAVYPYRDATGEVIYETVRLEPKTFRQRRPTGNGGFANNLEGIKPLPYRLPELLDADPSVPVLVVEGEKDADRAAELGFVVTSSHGGAGNTAAWDRLRTYFKGRRVVVLADNDGAGRKHAAGICDRLSGVAASVRLLELPGLPPKGDLSDWLDIDGDADRLRDLMASAPEWAAGAHITPSSASTPTLPVARASKGLRDPDRLAAVVILALYTHPDGMMLTHWADQWHAWDGPRWKSVKERVIKGVVWREIGAEFDRAAIAAADGKNSAPVTVAIRGNVMEAMSSRLILPFDLTPAQPAWIGGPREGEHPAVEYVSCVNGLVHMPSVARGDFRTLAPTPRYFNAHSLDYRFDPDAPSPRLWLGFLSEIFRLKNGEVDQASIDCLQEWFGYLVTQDTSLQMLLFIHGAPGSGKGTIARVLRAVVGPGNVAHPSLTSLGREPGLWAVVQKSVAILGEAEMGNRADKGIILERIKSITGEDNVQVERKYLENWDGKAPTRFVMTGNKLPYLADKSGALDRRFLFLKLPLTVEAGRRDPGLTGKLIGEVEGILLWSIIGLARLKARGYFLQPPSANDLVDAFSALSNLLKGFLADACRLGPDERVDVPDLYAAWKTYCTAKGIDHPGMEAMFDRDILSAVPSVESIAAQDSPSGTHQYRGIGLRLSKTPF